MPIFMQFDYQEEPYHLMNTSSCSVSCNIHFFIQPFSLINLNKKGTNIVAEHQFIYYVDSPQLLTT